MSIGTTDVFLALELAYFKSFYSSFTILREEVGLINVSFLDDLEKNIRDNKAPKLSHLISNVKPSAIPRSLLARYASLLRRMGGVRHALNILNPVVRNPSARLPSSVELLEYAACLTRLGLSEESLDVLRELKAENNPEVEFEMAAAYLSLWDCRSAVPHLQNFLRFPQVSPYRKFVGNMNLGAALVNLNKINEGKEILEKLCAEAQQAGFNLLAGNASELLAEVAIIEKNFREALAQIRNAKNILKNSPAKYELIAERRNLVIKLFQQEWSEDLSKAFVKVRKSAAALSEWNTVRELDIFRAIACNDQEKIISLYYGTSFQQLRDRIEFLWGKPVPKFQVYDRNIGLGKTKKNDIFDVAMGNDLNTGARLKPGQVLHRLLQTLSSEAHYPFSTTKLFSRVFRDLKFNPVTSPQQIYGAIRRLDKWFKQNKIPLFVDSNRQGYRLRSSRGYILRIKNPGITVTRADEFVSRLKELGLKDGFSLKLVLKNLKMPRRTVIRMLTEAVRGGRLKREGRTSLTKYFFVE